MNLGILLADEGDLPGATAVFGSAAARGNREHEAKARLNLLILKRRYREPGSTPAPWTPPSAGTPCRGAVRIGEMLVKRFPLEPAHRTLGINAAGRLGDLHLRRGVRKDARKWYARAHRAAARLAGAQPESAVGPLCAARCCW